MTPQSFTFNADQSNFTALTNFLDDHNVDWTVGQLYPIYYDIIFDRHRTLIPGEVLHTRSNVFDNTRYFGVSIIALSLPQESISV